MKEKLRQRLLGLAGCEIRAVARIMSRPPSPAQITTLGWTAQHNHGWAVRHAVNTAVAKVGGHWENIHTLAKQLAKV